MAQEVRAYVGRISAKIENQAARFGELRQSGFEIRGGNPADVDIVNARLDFADLFRPAFLRRSRPGV
jgi:hypothetical protein